MLKINTNTKILIFVIFLTSTIIVSGILSLKYFNSTANNLENFVNAAADSVVNSDWDLAKSNLDKFGDSWNESKAGWTILLDHFEIDNIDESFSKSKMYIESKDTSSARAELESLRKYIRHIPEKEKFTLKNIF